MKLVSFIGKDTQRFAELMQLFLGNEYRVTQRAAWVLSYCVEQHPEFIQPYFKRVIKNLGHSTIHNAVKRNTLRFLQDIDIPERFQGLATEHCFRFLLSTDEPVAIKVFAMTVLANLCVRHPDLKNELRLSIEKQMPYSSAGFKSRGRKILMNLNA